MTSGLIAMSAERQTHERNCLPAAAHGEPDRANEADAAQHTGNAERGVGRSADRHPDAKQADPEGGKRLEFQQAPDPFEGRG
jgi:hypothetical protein